MTEYGPTFDIIVTIVELVLGIVGLYCFYLINKELKN